MASIKARLQQGSFSPLIPPCEGLFKVCMPESDLIFALCVWLPSRQGFSKGIFPFFIPPHVISKLQTIMGSSPAAIRRISDQRHRIVPLCLQALPSAMIGLLYHFKTSCLCGNIIRCNPKGLRSETAQDHPPVLQASPLLGSAFTLD